MKNLRKKGFTLIELIVVIAIIGVLAAILVPSMIGYIKKSKRTSDISSAKTIYNNVMAVIADQGDMYDSFTANNPTKQPVTVSHGDDKATYDLVIVCSKDGAANAGNNYNVWGGGSKESQLFVEELNSMIGSGKTPVKYKTSIAGKPLNRWFICYREDNPLMAEIWVGDGTQNIPMYRLCPDVDNSYQ